MAWKTVLPMDERVKFALEVERGERAVAEICRIYGVSRKTGYKWIVRYRAGGIEGLRERSRRPLRSPRKTGDEWERRVVYERLKHPRWGPRKLRALLMRGGKGEGVPAASTIGGILKRLGFVRARRRRGHWPQPTRGPLTEAAYPNHVWAVDYKGWFRTRDGKRCEPLTVSDVYSRYVLGIRALHDQSHERAKEVFEKLFKKCGLPEIIRSDCGSPFASSGVGGLSRLSIWWIQLGIRPELIAPGHPEQNGVHERMHLTMKAEACQPPASAHKGQQQRFNRWRKEYNEERPHEALGMQTPSQRYVHSPRRYSGKIQQPVYPEWYSMRRVRGNGEIKWHGKMYFIGEALKGVLVGLEQVERGRSRVYFDRILLGDLYDANTKGSRCPVFVSMRPRPHRRVRRDTSGMGLREVNNESCVVKMGGETDF